MEKALAFNDVTFDVIQQNQQPWIRGAQIGAALGYVTDTSRAIRKLYDAHAEEFTPSMTQVVKLKTEGGMQDVRIFSLRGCHLLAMFARTPVAKAFRKWVLDILDSMAEGTTQTVDATITPDQQCTLQAIVKAKVEALPEEQRKGKFPQLWGRFNNHFRLARYSQLPQERMSEAVAYLTQLELAAPKALPATRARKKYAIGLVGYLDEMQDIVSEVHEKLTTRASSLFLALDQHSHKVPLSKNEELLLQSVHDYTDMAITGANLLLAGIAGSKRIKAVHSFKWYE